MALIILWLLSISGGCLHPQLKNTPYPGKRDTYNMAQHHSDILEVFLETILSGSFVTTVYCVIGMSMEMASRYGN
jgi:hypothetical protein